MQQASQAHELAVDLTHCRAHTDAYQAFQPGNWVCNAWGRGVGKSHFDRTMMYLLVAHWEHRARKTASGQMTGVRIVLVMPTLVQFKKVHANLLCNELAEKGPWGFLGADINRTDWRITFPGGSWIQVVSAETGTGAAGIRADCVVVDEADDVPIAFFEALAVPWFSEPWSLKMRLISGTPRRGRFGLLWKAYSVWPNGDAEFEAVPNAYGFHATYRDVPTLVDPHEAELARKTVSPDRFAREWLCDFDSGEGLVYPFFETGFHVREPPGLFVFNEYIVGVDYGFADPSVFLVIGVAGGGKDTICHVLREWYVFGKSATELAHIAKQVNGQFPNATWYVDHDPARTKTIKDETHLEKIYGADKRPGSVESGVSFVADALFIREDEDESRWAQLYVDPSCKHTIEEFGLYRRKRDPRNTDRVLDDIDTSKNDHCMDAIRYALVGHFGGPDKRLVVG